jgi:hypothetical protein
VAIGLFCFVVEEERLLDCQSDLYIGVLFSDNGWRSRDCWLVAVGEGEC